MRKYTEKIHAKLLLKILNRKDPCVLCPASKYYSTSNIPDDFWENDACVICCNFIGGNYISFTLKAMQWAGRPICPCNRLGHHEAIKLTWLALESKGYLE